MAAILNVLDNRYRLHIGCTFRDRQNPLDILSDDTIIKTYRLDRTTIYEICDMLNSKLDRPTKRSQSLPVSLQVLTALRFYATGAFQSVIGDGHNINKMSVSQCIRDVSDALASNSGNFIRFPKERVDQVIVKQKFFNLANFPNVLGAIDGTLIPIIGPHIDEHLYVCRKGFHTINVQGILDSDKSFANIVVRWPGSTHDSYIWAKCEVLRLFETGDIRDGWLLGDSGYPCQRWLLTPLLQPNSRAERKYNVAHKTTRNIVERGFGMWKMRFRCLHKSGGHLMFSPSRCIRVILSTAVLHNICIDKNIPLTDSTSDNGYDDGDIDNDLTQGYDGPLSDGGSFRQHIINTVFCI